MAEMNPYKIFSRNNFRFENMKTKVQKHYCNYGAFLDVNALDTRPPYPFLLSHIPNGI